MSSAKFLEKYRLIQRLGAGGLCEVWEVEARALPPGQLRSFALKRLRAEWQGSPEAQARLGFEGEALASIQHPNVVRLHEQVEVDGAPALVLERLSGASLHTCIARSVARSLFDLNISVGIVSRAAAGLGAVHAVSGGPGHGGGLVHADISPHNIFLGVGGETKLIDLGSARYVGASQPALERGFAQGKPGYLAPEAALGAPLDVRADLFALGVVLFELTTGKRLFLGKNVEATSALLARGELPPMSQLREGYPPTLEDLVRRAVAHDPQARFQSAEEFGAALDEYIYEKTPGVSPEALALELERVLGPGFGEVQLTPSLM